MIEYLVEATFLIFVRLSSFIAFLPLFGGKRVPHTVKIGLSVALTFIWVSRFAPSVALSLASRSPTTGEGQWLFFAWMISREAVIGASLGWLMGLIFVPLRITGAYIAQEMGLTIATLTSTTEDASSNVLSEVLDALMVLLFLGLNGHHLFFYSIGESLSLFPIGRTWDLPHSHLVLKSIAGTTTVGVQLAAPVAMLLLASTVGLLFIMRQTPQFNLFNFGMPIRLLTGLGALVLLIPEILIETTFLIQRLLSSFS